MCRDWTALAADLDSLAGQAIAVVLVADPFGSYDPADLHLIFPDVCRPYKEHAVVDLRNGVVRPNSENHRRNLRRAEREVTAERVEEPWRHASEWTELYAHLIARKSARGASAFSPGALVRQLSVPGLTMFRAIRHGKTVGIVLWYEHERVAYYHLAAYADEGYAVGASFALFQASIDYFQQRLDWLDLGAGAGVWNDGEDGLTRFKRGWATGTRTAWLCGRVLDRARYDVLAARCGPSEAFFPVYRAGEPK